MAIIFDGKKLAGELAEKLDRDVTEFKVKTGITPKLVSILVGDDPASVLYTKIKQKKAKSVGIDFIKKEFPENVEPEELISVIEQLNKDNSVHGIMIQLPLPRQSVIRNSQSVIVDTINPQKDVDCLTSVNLELVKQGKPRFLPATVQAIFKIINQIPRGAGTNSPLRCERSYCVVGSSGMVGKPLADYLENQGYQVNLCDEFTPDISVFTKQADILISATGIPNLIKKEMVKAGVVVIDVGSPVGDVDFENVSQVASFITPVPGGVGPLTVISLLENTLQACYNALA